VKAYIIDTGVKRTHTEFGGRVATGYAAGLNLTTDDCNGHGTHVAGTVGGSLIGLGIAQAFNGTALPFLVGLAACGLAALAASVFLIYELEILKRRRQLRAQAPGTSADEIDATVERELETGEFAALPPQASRRP